MELLHRKNKWLALGLVAAKEDEIVLFLFLWKSNTGDSCSAEHQRVSFLQ